MFVVFVHEKAVSIIFINLKVNETLLLSIIPNTSHSTDITEFLIFLEMNPYYVIL